MKIRCQGKDFLRTLNIVIRAIATKPTLPILANILIDASDDTVELTGYNMEAGIRCRMAAEIGAAGQVAVPAKMLQEIVSNLAEEEFDFESKDATQVIIKTPSSTYKLAGRPGDDYPNLPEFTDKDEQVTLPIATFNDYLRKTIFASSMEMSKTFTSGILMEFTDNKMSIVATDGRRLALIESELPSPRKAKKDIRALIPAEIMVDLNRILSSDFDGDIEINISSSLASFQFDKVEVISHLMDVSFPDYRKVVPTDFKGGITIDRKALIRSLKGVSIMAKLREGRDMAVLATKGKELSVTSSVENVGSALEKLPVEKEGKEEMQVAFNYNFFLDPLTNVDEDTVNLKYAGTLDPGVLTIPGVEGYTYVIMPVRMAE
jgi:DNA polymerase-3 subunit beta